MTRKCTCKYWCDCCGREVREGQLENIWIKYGKNSDNGEYTTYSKDICKKCLKKLKYDLDRVAKSIDAKFIFEKYEHPYAV